MNFQHMSQPEVIAHIEKFGSDEQRILLDKLHNKPPEIIWDDCPNCIETEGILLKARKKVDNFVNELVELLG